MQLTQKQIADLNFILGSLNAFRDTTEADGTVMVKQSWLDYAIGVMNFFNTLEGSATEIPTYSPPKDYAEWEQRRLVKRGHVCGGSWCPACQKNSCDYSL